MEIRHYQDLIANQALRENTIAFLPTGMGKTFVAMFVLERRLQCIRSHSGNSFKKIILIAPKKSLVNQHVRTLEKYVRDIRVKEFNGETYNDNFVIIDRWSESEWKREINAFDVLVMTSGICRSLLEKRYLRDDAIDLLILDECHYASGNDEMARVCDLIRKIGHEPLILGLTASPIKSKKGKILQSIVELERRTNCAFFLPTEEFVSNLNNFRTRTSSFIFHHPLRSTYNSMCGDEKAVLERWGKVLWRLDLCQYLQEIVDHDENFGTDMYRKLCQCINPNINFEVSRDKLQRYRELATWRKAMNQALCLTRSCGIMAACIGLERLILDRKDNFFGNFVSKINHKPHMNDETLLEQRIQDIRLCCDEIGRENFPLFLDQQNCVLAAVIEILVCILQLLPAGCKPENFFIMLTDGIGRSASQKDLSRLMGTLLRCRLDSPLQEMNVWRQMKRSNCPGDYRATDSDVVEVFTTIVSCINAEIFSHAKKNNKTLWSQWLKYPLINPRVQTLFTLLRILKSNKESERNEDLGIKSLTDELVIQYVPSCEASGNNGFEPSRIDFSHWNGLSNNSRSVDPSSEQENSSIIIFCELRLATVVLDELWQKIATSTNSMSASGVLHGNLSLSQQKEVLEKFREGKIQILFASEVAEEGIDIAKCRYVVHFDPPKTMKSQIQRRGRARAQDAQLIHLWPEIGTHEYGILLNQFTGFQNHERQMSEVLAQFRDTTQLLEIQHSSNIYRLQLGLGSVDLISAQEIVIKYCQVLPYRLSYRRDLSQGVAEFLPYYRYRRLDEEFSSEALLVLPRSKMVHLSRYGFPEFRVVGQSKRIAQGLAALEAVKWLWERGELDDHLKPITTTIRKTIEALRDDGMRMVIHSVDDGFDSDLELQDCDDVHGNHYEIQLLNLKTVPSSLEMKNVLNCSMTCSLHMYRIVFGSEAIGNDEVGPNQEFQEQSELLNHLRSVMILTESPVLTSEIALQGNGFLLTLIQEKLPYAAAATSKESEGFHNSHIFSRFEYCGVREFSIIEMNWIQRFHRGLVCMEPVGDSVVNDPAYPTRKMSELEFYLLDKSRVPDYSFDLQESIDPTWAGWSNGACYWVCPVAPLAIEASNCLSFSSSGISSSIANANLIFSIDYLIEATLEIELLLLNLKQIKLRNIERAQFLDILLPTVATQSTNADNRLIAAILSSEETRAPYVFTSTGNSLFRFGVSTETVVLSDKMNEDGTTFAAHYRRKHHRKRIDFIDSCLVGEFAEGWKISDGDLKKGYMLSGKFTLRNLLQPGPSASSPADCLTEVDSNSDDPDLEGTFERASPDSPPGARDNCVFLPAFSLPIGKLKWYSLLTSLPCILARFQAVAMAKEVQDTVFAPLLRALSIPFPTLDTILAAMTSRRVMENISFERLEFLGDCFLKFATSLYLVLETLTSSTNKHLLASSSLSCMRQRLICNDHLVDQATSWNIRHYLRLIPISEGLKKLTFRMPGARPHVLSLRNVNIQTPESLPEPPSPAPPPSPDVLIEPVEYRGTSTKIYADFVEALLGTAFVSGLDRSVEVTPAAWEVFVSLILRDSPTTDNSVPITDVIDKKWTEVWEARVWNDAATDGALRAEREEARALACTMGDCISYKWQDPMLLLLAVTHSSYCRREMYSTDRFLPHYELFEFLGDAVLDLLVVQELYRRFPTWSEKELSESKSQLVCNEALAQHADRLDLLQYIRHENLEVTRWKHQVNAYYNDLLAKNPPTPFPDALLGSNGADILGEEVVEEGEEVDDDNLCAFVKCREVDLATSQVANLLTRQKIARKILADVVEAIVGAVFVDSRGKLTAVQEVLETMGIWEAVTSYEYKATKNGKMSPS